jgi:P4 family phage/plasmid primase-like protien
MAEQPNMERLPGAGGLGFEEELWVQKFLRKVPLRTKGTDWYVHNAKAWSSVESERFHPVAKMLLPRGQRSVKNIMAIIAGAQADRQLREGEEFVGAMVMDRETRTVFVNCQNGVLKVSKECVELMPHDQMVQNTRDGSGRLFMACLDAEWRGEWTAGMAPLFMKTLWEALPDAQDRALQQWFSGYILYPACEHEVCLISYGDAGTGKSTISDAVMAVIGGSPLKTVLSLAQLCAEGQGGYSLPSLQYACVNMGTELDTVDMKDSSNVKRFVSGEPVEVRSIYGKPFPMLSHVKLWFNSNSLPRFKNGTDAELRRVRFLRFSQKVAEQDKDRGLKAKLVEERNGVLSWMIEALQAILGGMTCPLGGKDSNEIKTRFALANDPVGAFCDQCCVFGPGHEETKEAIYAAFSDFMGGHGFAVKTKDALFRRFYERNPHVEVDRRKAGEERVYWLKGVSLRKEAAAVAVA